MRTVIFTLSTCLVLILFARSGLGSGSRTAELQRHLAVRRLQERSAFQQDLERHLGDRRRRQFHSHLSD